MTVRASLAAVAAVLAGCSARTVQPPVTAAHPSRAYIDLQPGWRLRVVTPLLRSGGYRLQSLQQSSSGNTIALSTQDDFMGYERAYYVVKPHSGGVRVEFSSAETVEGDQRSPRQRPVEPLFQISRSARHVRLLYLRRVSDVDHEMAVVAAARREELDELTLRVQEDPATSCRRGRRVDCAWIPAGISVQPEMVATGGGAEWIPAR